MSLHSNLAFRNLQCTICIFKTSKMTQIHLFVMNFNKSAVLVDSGFGLGRFLADRRHAAPKDRKYQRVKNQTASVGGQQFESDQWKIQVSFVLRRLGFAMQWVSHSITNLICFLLNIKKFYTDRNILEDSYKLIKHFPDFPLWEYTIAAFNQKFLIEGSNSFLPEREIREMFY